MTLKVGDRVRVKRHVGGLRVGDVSEVIDHGTAYPYRVRDASRQDGGVWMLAHEVEKIEDPTPKFKVGDRARDSFSKDVVTIMATDAHSAWPIRARYADGGYGLWKESELTKVESVPFKLERGDKVVNRKTGRTGVVIYGMVHDDQPPFEAPVPAAALEEYEEHYPGSYDLIKKDAPW